GQHEQSTGGNQRLRSRIGIHADDADRNGASGQGAVGHQDRSVGRSRGGGDGLPAREGAGAGGKIAVATIVGGDGVRTDGERGGAERGGGDPARGGDLAGTAGIADIDLELHRTGRGARSRWRDADGRGEGHVLTGVR